MKKHAILFISTIALCCSIVNAKESSAEIVLFDGTTLDHFQAKSGGPVTKGWKIDENGLLFRHEKGGDIVTKQTFADFEFTFEWKISEAGNSGIKYRHAKYNAGLNGPEYQILDDAGHGNGKNPYTSAGAMYLLAKRSSDDPVKKAGEWNVGKIVAKGSHVEHWLNGVKVVELDLASDAFDTQLKQTKFKKYEQYGQLKGQIMLQDHNDLVWYRNLKIREL